MTVGRDAPTSVMLSGTLTGVAVIFAIFMSRTEDVEGSHPCARQ
jgi:hypothetical protein